MFSKTFSPHSEDSILQAIFFFPLIFSSFLHIYECFCLRMAWSRVLNTNMTGSLFCLCTTCHLEDILCYCVSTLHTFSHRRTISIQVREYFLYQKDGFSLKLLNRHVCVQQGCWLLNEQSLEGNSGLRVKRPSADSLCLYFAFSSLVGKIWIKLLLSTSPFLFP